MFMTLVLVGVLYEVFYQLLKCPSSVRFVLCCINIKHIDTILGLLRIWI